MTTDPQHFQIYQSEDGTTRIDVMLQAQTLWLNQKQLTDLFGNLRAGSTEKTPGKTLGKTLGKTTTSSCAPSAEGRQQQRTYRVNG